jgi:hypothetical protein
MKLLAFLALAIPLAVFAAPIDREVVKKDASPDDFGNYGEYGNYGSYEPPAAGYGSYPTPPGGYGSYPAPADGYGSYGSYRRDAEPAPAE